MLSKQKGIGLQPVPILQTCRSNFLFLVFHAPIQQCLSYPAYADGYISHVFIEFAVADSTILQLEI